MTCRLGPYFGRLPEELILAILADAGNTRAKEVCSVFYRIQKDRDVSLAFLTHLEGTVGKERCGELKKRITYDKEKLTSDRIIKRLWLREHLTLKGLEPYQDEEWKETAQPFLEGPQNFLDVGRYLEMSRLSETPPCRLPGQGDQNSGQFTYVWIISHWQNIERMLKQRVPASSEQ